MIKLIDNLQVKNKTIDEWYLASENQLVAQNRNQRISFITPIKHPHITLLKLNDHFYNYIDDLNMLTDNTKSLAARINSCLTKSSDNNDSDTRKIIDTKVESKGCLLMQAVRGILSLFYSKKASYFFRSPEVILKMPINQTMETSKSEKPPTHAFTPRTLMMY